MEKARNIDNLLNKRVKVYNTSLGTVHYGKVVAIEKKYNEVKILTEDDFPQTVQTHIKYIEEV